MSEQGRLQTLIPFVMMGIYFAVVIGLSARASFRVRRRQRGQSFEDFYTGGKSMPAVVVGLVTIVTFYSGTTFTGRVGFFYNFGVVGLTTLFSSAASGIIMYFLTEKVWPLSKAWHCSTLSDMLELRYRSRVVKLLTSLIIVSFNIIWLITEIRTLGMIVNIASGGVISQVLGSFLAFSLIMTYVCTGGIHSVAAVDSFSAAFMLTGSVVVVVYLIFRFYGGSIRTMFASAMQAAPELWTVSNQGTYGYSYWVSSILVSTIVMLVYPSNYMSICLGDSVRSVKKASIAVAFSGPWLMIYGIIAAAALGLARQGFVISNPEAALLEMSSLSGNVWILGIVTTFVLAASLGTLDSTLISLSGLLSNDIVINVQRMRSQAPLIGDDRKEGTLALDRDNVSITSTEDIKAPGSEVRLTRILILLLGTTAMFLSTKQLTLMVLMANYASNGLLQVVPAVIGGLFCKNPRPQAAISSMLAGVGSYLLLDTTKRVLFHGDPSFLGGYFLGLPALLIGTCVWIIVQRCANHQKNNS